MNISWADKTPVLVQMDENFSANPTTALTAKVVAAKEANVNKQVAHTVIGSLETKRQTGTAQAPGRGIDLRA